MIEQMELVEINVVAAESLQTIEFFMTIDISLLVGGVLKRAICRPTKHTRRQERRRATPCPTRTFAEDYDDNHDHNWSLL